MKYLLVINKASYNSQRIISSLLFAEALLKKDHIIDKVFFYADATTIANKNIYYSSDETNFLEKWVKLSKNYKFELHLCHTAASKRGIVESNTDYLDTNFILSGLSVMSESLLMVDRVVQF